MVVKLYAVNALATHLNRFTFLVSLCILPAPTYSFHKNKSMLHTVLVPSEPFHPGLNLHIMSDFSLNWSKPY